MPPPADPSALATEPPALGSRWIETDSYDRDVFSTLTDDSPSLRNLAESGGRLLPHFEDFLIDLFAVLYKMNIVFLPVDRVVPSAGFYRFLLDQIARAPALEIIRQQTALDETKAGLATLLLGERILSLLKTERIVTRSDMLDYWNLQRHEEEIARQTGESQTAEMLRRRVSGRVTERQLGGLKSRMEREMEASRRHLVRHSDQIRQNLQEGEKKHRQELHSQLNQTMLDMERVKEDAETWSIHLGGGRKSSPGAQVELGSRLARNHKLKRMAQMVGRMRETARALRRKLYERGSTEVYEIGLGADLSHLLPSELVGLSHPLLRRDFARRLVERELLVYELKSREEKGRGPMIVCLDGSSSMEGEKEIWSKAVTLTLLDLARRHRRKFRSIGFASPETPLQVLDLNTAHRYEVDMQQVFAIAEYFPGGGTDFQKPLSAAVDCLEKNALKKGDIVLITDGECRVDPDWLRAFKQRKEALGFSLFSVLIDVGSSSLGALRELSDRITSVSRLTSDATKDIFLELDR